MNKTLKVLLGGLLGLAFVGVANAAPGVRGGKSFTTINSSATAVLACKGPATVYSVILSTGATTDYGVLRDTNTANTTSAPAVRIPHATATLTQVTFDPPLIFKNGVSFDVPASTLQATVTCENGRVLQGY